MAHLLKTAWQFGLPLYSPTTHYYLPSHSYLGTLFANEWHGGLLELACYTFGWVVSIDEGRDRNLGTTSHNESGNVSPAAPLQSTQELSYGQQRIPSGQSGYSNKCQKTLENLGTA